VRDLRKRKACIYAHREVRIGANVYVCMFVCMYVCMYVCSARSLTL
jgi:hypothetical protein